MKGILSAIAILVLIAGFLLLVRMAMTMFAPRPVANPFDRKQSDRAIDGRPDQDA